MCYAVAGAGQIRPLTLPNPQLTVERGYNAVEVINDIALNRA